MAVKLYYFDGRGIAEPIRWILAYGGIQFEEVLAPVTGLPPTLPPEIKAKCRWGQVPLVEFEGKSLTQSAAIARYFAKKCNLVPKNNDYLAALADEYVDTVKDLIQGIGPIFSEKDEQKKKDLLKETCASAKTRFLDKFEAIIKANDGKHLVGNSMTWADIALIFYIQQFHILFKVDLSNDYPSLKALRTTVESAPGIKEWLAKRPLTIF